MHRLTILCRGGIRDVTSPNLLALLAIGRALRAAGFAARVWTREGGLVA